MNAKPICAFLLAAALCLVLASPGQAGAADKVPAGFVCRGSRLPADGGCIGHYSVLIREHGLREVVPPHREAREKWGTSVLPADEKRGYIVFGRHYLEPVCPYSLPNNRVQELSLFASLGEYEPATFSLYPVRNVKGLRISASGLKSASGSAIGNVNLELRKVRPLPFRKGKKGYVLEPLLLETFDSIDLAKGEAVRVWLTFYAPRDAAAGTYAGTIRLEAEGVAEELRLTATVLPIVLPEPETSFGMCFLIPGHENLHPENLDLYFVDLREHGLNTMWTWPDAGVKKEGEKIIYDFSKFGFVHREQDYFGHSLDQLVDAYLKAGLRRPWICGSLDPMKDSIAKNLGYSFYTAEFDRAYVAFIRQLREHAARKKWPEFSLHVIDEPSNGGEPTMRFAKYYNKLVKAHFPDARLFADGVFGDERTRKWPEDRILAPYLDIMAYQSHTRDDIAFCRKRGLEFWVYNRSGMGKCPNFDRDRWGVFAAKAGFKGCMTWVYTWWTKPNMPSDFFMYVLPAPDGPLPTAAWEAVREGIDDQKYITALSALIKKAGASRDQEAVAAATEAQQCLADILAPVPMARPGNQKEKAERNRYFHEKSMATYDDDRRRVARHIVRLQELVAGR